MNFKILNKTILITLTVVFVCSCKKDTHYVKKHYYPTGELLTEITYNIKDSLKDGSYKEYYKNKQLKQLMFFKDDKPVDSALQYHKNGRIKFREIRGKDTIKTVHYHDNGVKFIEGNFLNREKPIESGWFKFYRKNESLSDSVEYINVNNKGYLNQRYHYDENKKIVKDSSRYYSFQLSQIKDSTYQYKISYEPMIKDAKVCLIVDSDINENFSNLKELEMDTIFMKNNSITATITTKTPYKKQKGFFYEYKAYVKDTVSEDSVRMTIKEKYTYFNTITYPDNLN